MEHSTLDPSGMPPPLTTRRPSSYRGGPVKVLMKAPFQYSYGSKSHWVTTGEWYSLDPIKDREEILYLQSSSNPYKQFIHIEGEVGTDEEKGLPYSYGAGYPMEDPTPPFRSNALIPNEEPGENPHIQETLARAGLQPPSGPVPMLIANAPIPMPEDEVVTVPPDNGDRPPTYGEEVAVERPTEVIVMEDIEELPSKEDELRSMKASNIKALAASMGLEYKDKESAIRQILEVGGEHK